MSKSRDEESKQSESNGPFQAGLAQGKGEAPPESPREGLLEERGEKQEKAVRPKHRKVKARRAQPRRAKR